MFHTYVNNFCGNSIDLDRARFLMDKGLELETAEWLKASWPELEKQGASTRAQAFFDHYCFLHHRKYDASFAPDVDKNWS